VIKEKFESRESIIVAIGHFIPLPVLMKISKTFKQNSEVCFNKVMSAEEAKQMTDNDKTGHVWSVGDQYYLLHVG
jgi:hypothetical protein